MPVNTGTASPTVGKADSNIEEKTPQEVYHAQLGEVIKRCGAEGYMIIRGIERDYDEDDEDEDEGDEDDSVGEPQAKKRRIIPASKYESFRIVLATKSLVAEVKKADKFATCGQSGDSIKMYNTHTGNTVIEGTPKMLNTAMRRKTLSAKFDSLLALTYCIKVNDCWVYDNEYGEEGDECDTAIQDLARAWKKLLAHSNSELGIDAEYTRPGVEALLEDFAELVNKGYAEHEFPWR